MKRGREVDSIITMANYLMLLSGRGRSGSSSKRSVFECKTCKRQFASFQALGGHRASHKKPRLMMGESDDNRKPKTHECSICGLEFAIGQALGGHMRGHRPPNPNNHPKTLSFPDLNLTPLENDLEFFKIRQASLL